MKAALLALALAVIAYPAAGADCGSEVHLEGKVVQSGLVHGQAAPGSRIYLDGFELRVGPEGRFLFGFGRDHPARALLWVICPDGSDATLPLSIARRSYDISRIGGLPPKSVSPPAEELERIRREREIIAAARRFDTPETFYEQGFVWPVTGRTTAVYGAQRIVNGEPQEPHTGVDIAAPLGTAVHAPAAGIVRLAAEELHRAGGTLVLDHGYGLSSTFFHLQRLRVREGDRVSQDEIVATLGASGAAKEPHLEWQVTWFEHQLDPALLVGPASRLSSARE